MRFFLLSKVDGSAAVSLGFADDFKEGYWDQPPGGRDKGIARLVPIWVVLPANNVEKISLAEGQFLSIPWFGLVIVERLDDLLWRQNGDGGFGRNGQMVVVVGFGILLPFQRASESLHYLRS